MITSERFCLSYDPLNVILSPSKFVNFNENLHCCKGRRHDVTCAGRKCCVTCCHNIILLHEAVWSGSSLFAIVTSILWLRDLITNILEKSVQHSSVKVINPKLRILRLTFYGKSASKCWIRVIIIASLINFQII